jgi:hypothetical protein
MIEHPYQSRAQARGERGQVMLSPFSLRNELPLLVFEGVCSYVIPIKLNIRSPFKGVVKGLGSWLLLSCLSLGKHNGDIGTLFHTALS